MTPLPELLATATARLEAAGVASPRVDAELIAAHVLGVERGRLPLVDSLDRPAAHRYRLLLARRLAREPLQHLTGTAPFRHLELLVGRGVFLPRPETELVAQAAVDEAARLAERAEPGPLVVDLGTGSGAIALAVATEVPRARVHAVELDPVALGWATRNLAAIGVADRVRLHLDDAATALVELDGTVDVVVANPPYVPLAGSEALEPEVRVHDPAVAVFGGADGLDGPRTVLVAARRLLRPGGLVVVEHDDQHGESAPGLLAGAVEWTEVADHRDLAGRPRYLTARRTSRHRPGARP